MKNALKHKQDMKKIQASSLDSGKVSAAITQQRPLQRLPSNGPHFFWNRLRAGKLDTPRLTLITYERRLSHRSPDTILTQEFKHRQAKIFLKRGVFFHNNAPAQARPTVGLDLNVTFSKMSPGILQDSEKIREKLTTKSVASPEMCRNCDEIWKMLQTYRHKKKM